MNNLSKIKQELLEGMSVLKNRILELERSETERKRAEEWPRGSENWYQSIFENADEGIFQASPAGRFLRVNPALARMHGFESPEEMVTSVADTQIFMDPAARQEHLKMLDRKGAVVNFELELYRKDRSRIWVSTSARAVHNDNGDVLYYKGMVEDITERKATEKALKESQELFHTVLDSIDADVYVADIDSHEILFANEHMKLVFGDITGLTCWKALHRDQTGPCPFCTSSRLLTPSGEPTEPIISETFRPQAGYWVERRDRAIRWLDGRIVRIQVATNITARKHAEEALKKAHDELELRVQERTTELKESEKKYRNIFEEAVVGIYQTTPEGRFRMVNPYFARLHGFESPEECVRSITDIATQIYAEPERRNDFLALMEKDGIARNLELKTRTRDGVIKRVTLNAHAVKGKDGKILWHEGILLDITEKKLVHELVARQRDLVLRLAEADNLQNGLDMILETAVMASGMECGGIFLKNVETGGFDLVSSVGLTEEFQDKVRHVPAGTFLGTCFMEKKSLHTRTNGEPTPISLEWGFQSLSLMPVLARDEVTGGLVMASKVLTDIPEQVRTFLELLAAGSGNTIARIQARERLEAEITTRREAERALEVERQSLQEANTALKVLLKHGEDNRKELEEKFLANVQQLVLPHVEKLKKSALNPVQQMSVNFIESNLGDLVSPFVKGIRDLSLTQRQMEVATLIRAGKTTKEIADILNIGKRAVDIQRFWIRKKLGLNKAKINLQAYLKTLS